MIAAGLVERVAALLADGAYAGGWSTVRALPEPLAVRVFDLGADLAVRRGGRGVDQLRANLARVAPGEDLTRSAMRSYARYWREVFRLPVLPRARLVGGMRTTDEHVWRAAVEAEPGLVVVLPHSGNWDHAGAWAAARGVPFTTVAERLRPESVFERFVTFRSSLGMEVLPLTGGPRPVVRVLSDRLQAGGMLCLLGDRDLSSRGVDVELFGATARLPAGPATLALRTGATLMPVSLAFAPDGWLCTFHEPVPHTDVATMTQRVADALATGIAAHPADWHMLQPLWVEDLPAPARARVHR